MTTDAWLAIAHHLAAFGILAVLAAEWALVRPGLAADGVRRVGRVDAAYGGLAIAVLAAGLARVVWGDKPAAFYLENPVFWLKLGTFAAVGALSVRPTIRYLRWGRAVDADPTAVVPAGEAAAGGRAIRLQLLVFPAIPVLAALMARGIGT